jgi:hypothetical protein
MDDGSQSDAGIQRAIYAGAILLPDSCARGCEQRLSLTFGSAFEGGARQGRPLLGVCASASASLPQAHPGGGGGGAPRLSSGLMADSPRRLGTPPAFAQGNINLEST